MIDVLSFSASEPGTTKKRLAKCELDAGGFAAFPSIFLASSFSAPKQNPRPPQRQYHKPLGC